MAGAGINETNWPPANTARSLLSLLFTTTTTTIMSQQDDLAYGQYYQGSDRGASDSARGLVGDTFNKLRQTYKSHHGSGQPGQQTYNQGGPQTV